MRLTLTIALAAAVLMLGLCAVQAAKTTTMPGSIAVDATQVTVKVVNVDHSARTMSLQMPNGKIKTYKVGKEAKSFSQIKKGDLIKATLVDSLAVYVQKSGGRPSAAETTTVTLSPRGALPGMIIANTYRITGKVQLVDMRNRTITITGPSYRSKAFKVGPNVKNLASVKAGDDVVLRYTEALAIDVQKPKK